MKDSPFIENNEALVRKAIISMILIEDRIYMMMKASRMLLKDTSYAQSGAMAKQAMI